MITAKKELINVPISDLTPYERNPRKNDKAVKKVAASLEQFGLVKNSVVVDEDMVLITGHTTLKAMRSPGSGDGSGWGLCRCAVPLLAARSCGDGTGAGRRRR